MGRPPPSLRQRCDQLADQNDRAGAGVRLVRLLEARAARRLFHPERHELPDQLRGAVLWPAQPTRSCRPNGTYANYVLPLGNTCDRPASTPSSYGDGNIDQPPAGLSRERGSTGAGYPIAAGRTRTLRDCSTNLPGCPCHPGFDGVDNNSNNLVDEAGLPPHGEGGWNRREPRLTTRTTPHGPRCSTRSWSRGRARWGSVFSRDDFTDREVQDTDGDGLARVCRCLGPAAAVLPLAGALSFRPPARAGDPARPGDPEHLEPAAAVSDFQLGDPHGQRPGRLGVSGAGARSARPQPATDGPAVVGSTTGSGQTAANDSSPFVGSSPAGSVNASGGVQAFEYFFHRLTEPMPRGTDGNAVWDRSGTLRGGRYYSKFLILSGGRDKQPGCLPVRRFRHEPAWATAPLPT